MWPLISWLTSPLPPCSCFYTKPLRSSSLSTWPSGEPMISQRLGSNILTLVNILLSVCGFVCGFQNTFKVKQFSDLFLLFLATRHSSIFSANTGSLLAQHRYVNRLGLHSSSCVHLPFHQSKISQECLYDCLISLICLSSGWPIRVPTRFAISGYRICWLPQFICHWNCHHRWNW